MTSAPLIPVTVLTGFLGSGKTTVLNHLLRQPGMDGMVVVINEFGEVGLDHLLVETSEERFALLDNGCVCCSVREDLVALLGELSVREADGEFPPIKRILIETTGLADPVPVLHTLMTAPSVMSRYRIDGVVVTVDAVNALRSLDHHAEAVKQIAVADRILLTKADLAEADIVADVERRIGSINPTVSVTRVNHGCVEPGIVFEAGLFAPEARSEQVANWFAAAATATTVHPHAAHHHDHHAHGSDVTSFSLIVREPIRWAAFSRWLDYVAALKGDDLLRFKALVNIADRPEGPVVVHGVQHVLHPPIALDAWPSDDRSSRLVFIVRDIPAEAIERTLARFGEISRDSISRPAARDEAVFSQRIICRRYVVSETSKFTTKIGSSKISRRSLLKAAGTAGLAAASNVPLVNIAGAASSTIKIGWCGCLSGVRAAFAEPDPWIHERMKKLVKDGLKIGGKNYAVEFVIKDNQSDPNRSSVVASELVLREKCDLILVEDGDAEIPIGELADARGVPTISTMLPWQGWMFPRKSTPDKGFPYTFHFFWGADDVVKNFVGMWQSAETNKKVGTLYIDNPAGMAFSDQKLGLPAGIKQADLQEISTGSFQIATDDFSNQVSAFKNAGVDIVSGFAYGNHWVTLWNQAAQAGFRPQICTVAAAFLFPSAVNALGDRGDGMSTEVWWTPAYPFKSSLTGQTAAELAAEWEKTTGKQWTQPIGYAHALWEVGFGALRNSDPKDKNSLRDAIAGLDLETVVGPVKFKGSPIKNVAVTSLSGGQWRKTKGGKSPYELLIVHNGTSPFIPKQADLQLLSKLA